VVLIVKKELSERVHNCPGCGISMDRDLNAAINILRLGMQSLRQIDGSPALKGGEHPHGNGLEF
jgi:putative transposase